MSKEAFQDLLLLMDSKLEEVGSKERERKRERKPPRQLWRWKSKGKENVGDEKRPHCPTGRGVQIIKS